ncbi:DUF4830 domain-containing protein [Desulfosporosinus sp. PR]|uniref:DUF4830 domain-containing protein n=1 Tax=Candidatus Desulfosporosinus nitrosoreducens TaxID=3401928 RepID=UPI0027F0C1DB|nr:DUF4830 domain-containing protein [Desulfosporosinus sp. PR]MDQ7093638.1 DUF4830 domain-containing protein [Desulfosporosinus sp. PR]
MKGGIKYLVVILIFCPLIVINGCSQAQSKDVTTAVVPTQQDLIAMMNMANDLGKKFGWEIDSKPPTIQTANLNLSIWKDPLGVGPIWQFNEVLSSSIGLPFKDLVGKSVEIWAYPVSKPGNELKIVRYLCLVVYNSKVHGAWIADGGPNNVPGFPLDEKIPADFKNFALWLHQAKWIVDDEEPLKSLVGKDAPAVIKEFYNKGITGNIESAELMITPMGRTIGNNIDPKSYWKAYFQELTNITVKSIDPVNSVAKTGSDLAVLSADNIAFVHPTFDSKTYSVRFSNSKQIFVTVVKESSQDPWMIQSISKTP